MSNDRYFLVIILGNLSHHVGNSALYFCETKLKKIQLWEQRRNNVTSESVRLV